MDSWSYETSGFLPNGTSLLPPENPISMSQGLLSNEFDKNDANVFSAVSSSSCVVPSSLLHAEVDDDHENLSKLSRLDFKLKSLTSTLLPGKKPRASSSSPLCQVHGCNMDLSSSKDYHKRHRVCETHSKTSVVIVSGFEQRFCQQCSKFHLLSEFDNGKRSCRRRLAGHNERRRKPSFYFLPGKHKQLHKLQGNKFPCSFLYRGMDEQDHQRASRLVSFKDEPMFPAQTRSYESTWQAASGVSSIWDLHEAVPSSASCAHTLLSAQSQQHLSETNPNKSFSVTQPNQTLNASRISYHQMQSPLRTDLAMTKTDYSSPCNGDKVSSTVDLMQLSSHLQRIEQQQRSFTNDVKQECNNELYYFPSS